MFMLFASLLALLIVVALGGRFSRLADVSLSHLWTVWVALGLQIILFTPLGSGFSADHLRVGQLLSYLPIVAFLMLNRRLGMGLLGAGVSCNLIAIAANGGFMPADPLAREAVFGPDAVGGQHLNIDSSADRLAFLGDTMATPQWMPFASALSVGDLLIAIGLVWLVARLTVPVEPIQGAVWHERVVEPVVRTWDGVRTHLRQEPKSAHHRAAAVVVGASLPAAVVAAGREYAGRLEHPGVVAVLIVAVGALACGAVMAASMRSEQEARAAGVALVLGGWSVVMAAVAPIPMTTVGAVACLGLALGTVIWWARELLGTVHERAMWIAVAMGLEAGVIGPSNEVLLLCSALLAGLGLVVVASALRIGQRPAGGIAS